jgi:fumarate reductase subunit D
MSEERIEKLEKSLTAARTRLDRIEAGQRTDREHFGYGVTACTVAGALFVLTATTWRSAETDSGRSDQATTLWGMAADGWQGVATLALVLLLVVGTMAVFTGEGSRTSHLVFAGIAVLTVVAIAFVGQVEPTGWYDADDTTAGAGRWLAALACVTLAILHGARSGDHRS